MKAISVSRTEKRSKTISAWSHQYGNNAKHITSRLRPHSVWPKMKLKNKQQNQATFTTLELILSIAASFNRPLT
jgi:hypothetical protein